MSHEHGQPYERNCDECFELLLDKRCLHCVYHDGKVVSPCDHHAELSTLRAQLAAKDAELNRLHDCGQDGVCALAPGCIRHFAARGNELVAALSAAETKCQALEAEVLAGENALVSKEAELVAMREGLQEALLIAVNRCATPVSPEAMAACLFKQRALLAPAQPREASAEVKVNERGAYFVEGAPKTVADLVAPKTRAVSEATLAKVIEAFDWLILQCRTDRNGAPASNVVNDAEQALALLDAEGK